MNGLWLAIGLAALAFLAWRAVPIWMDGGQRGVKRRLYWTFVGIVAPWRYWWGARIEAMPESERAGLLAHEKDASRLSRADSLRCPLCGAEVTRAWALDSKGRPTVAPGPVQCPCCDLGWTPVVTALTFFPARQGLWAATT